MQTRSQYRRCDFEHDADKVRTSPEPCVNQDHRQRSRAYLAAQWRRLVRRRRIWRSVRYLLFAAALLAIVGWTV